MPPSDGFGSTQAGLHIQRLSAVGVAACRAERTDRADPGIVRGSRGHHKCEECGRLSPTAAWPEARGSVFTGRNRCAGTASNPLLVNKIASIGLSRSLRVHRVPLRRENVRSAGCRACVCTPSHRFRCAR